MIRATISALPVPGATDLAIGGLARDVATHDAHMATVPGLNLIETGGSAPGAPLGFPLTLGSWNMERCLFPEASARHVADCDVLLLSEMDNGMARTAQRNTTAEMAADLGMAYAYVAEFLELGLGSDSERRFCTDDHNALGYHGTAVAARAALGAPFATRLWGRRQWFADEEQPRLGERVAIGATLETAEGPLVVVATHLESACGPDHRTRQVESLIAALDSTVPGLPCLIAGDLNTGNHNGGDWRAEGLFDIVRAAGFEVHGGDEDQPTTRPSLITRWPERTMKLDWMLTRGLRMGPVEIRPSLDPDGRPLSDHEALVAQVLGIG